MKLTIRWSDLREEGVLSAADVRDLMDRAKESWGERVHVLDFLRDAVWEVSKLYDEMREAVPADTACHSAEQHRHETTSNDAQSD